jgi:hypothetical protein
VSSNFVRTEFKNFITAALTPPDTLIDLSGQYSELDNLLSDQGVSLGGIWTGIEFFPGDEIPISIGSNNTQGKYRENGTVYIHVVGIASLGAGSQTILDRAEVLRNALRGQRLGSIFVESVSPPSFNDSDSFGFGQGYVAVSFLVGFQNDLDL